MPPRPAGRSSTSAPAPAASASTSPATATRSSRSTWRRTCSLCCAIATARSPPGALADALESFDAEHVLLPLPDRLVVDGTLYSSQPVALRDNGATVAIERIREIIRADGRRSASDDILHLDRVGQREIEDEARAAGLTPLPGRVVPATEEHVGTSVVILRG